MIRDGITVKDIFAYRDSHPVGSTVTVPVEKYIGNGNNRKIVIEHRNAIVLEPHSRVVVTSAGTFSWTQIVLLERGADLDDE